MKSKTIQEFKETEIGKIPKDWVIKKLESICDVKSGKRLPKGEQLVNYKTNHPYIRVKNLENGTINIDNLLFLDEQTFEKISKYTITSDDVYISIVGTIGVVGLVPEEVSGGNLTENCAKFTSFNGTTKEWIHYFLTSSMGQEQIRKLIVGTTQGKLALFRIRNMYVPLPLLEEQKSISNILKNLDMKIRIIGNQNKILEQIIQTIFKSWFIDFDGITEFEDSELGKIPKGWGVKSFSDIYFITDYTANGSFASLKENVTYSYTPDYAILVRQVDFNNNWNDDYVYVDKHSYDFLKKSSLISGDVMISNIGNVGIVFRVPDLGQPMTGAPNVLVVKTEEFNREFAYSYLFSEVGQNIIKSITSGSAQPKFNKTDFRNHLFVYPNRKSLDKFHEKVSPITQLITKNEKLIKLLQDSKYSLLPKLMSGEIRV